jgi:hypothetical protein
VFVLTVSYGGGRVQQFSVRRERVAEVRRWLDYYHTISFCPDPAASPGSCRHCTNVTGSPRKSSDYPLLEHDRTRSAATVMCQRRQTLKHPFGQALGWALTQFLPRRVDAATPRERAHARGG